MRVDYILATHLQCRPRSDRVKAALADGLVTLRDADGAETPQERQPLGENRQAVDVGLPRAYYPLGPSPSLVKT